MFKDNSNIGHVNTIRIQSSNAQVEKTIEIRVWWHKRTAQTVESKQITLQPFTRSQLNLLYKHITSHNAS